MDIWYAITLLGEPLYWVLLLSALMFLYIIFRDRIGKNKRETFKEIIAVGLISVILASGFTSLAKQLIPVERPCIPCPADGCNPYCPKDKSFPSGHASATFAFFTSLILVLGKPKYLVLLVIPFLVSISRIALGVHYPVDVVAGAFFGVATAFFVFHTFRKRYNVFFE